MGENFPLIASKISFKPLVDAGEGHYSILDTDAAGNQFVWVADKDKRANRIPVTVGEQRDARIEILEGLTGKERVVVNPDGQITDGAFLTIDE